jgi:hypothetical protein
VKQQGRKRLRAWEARGHKKTLLVIDVAKRNGNPKEGFFGVVPERDKDERTRKRTVSQ